MTHAWCSDPARDEAVRAAEDNRQGPLPTLEEAIADPFTKTARIRETETAVEPVIPAADAQGGGGGGLRFERSLSLDSLSLGKDGNVTARFVAAAEIEAAVPIAAGCAAPETPANGMRTERVTLELTGRFDSPPSEWPWEAIFSQDCRVHIEPGDNVRVVEEANGGMTYEQLDTANGHLSDLVKSLTDERDAAIRERDEAISRAGQFAASEAPQGQKCTERESGLRTERVTIPWQREKWDEALAVIVNGGEWGRGNGFHAGIIAALVIWADKTMVGLTAERDAAIRERDEYRRALTVENDHALRIAAERDALKARVAELEAERDAARAEEKRLKDVVRQLSVKQFVRQHEAAPAASGAANSSAGPKSSEPVAWGVRTSNGLWMQASLDVEGMMQLAIRCEASCRPLFASPPPARGWLTAEERKCVKAAITVFGGMTASKDPEKVLLDFWVEKAERDRVVSSLRSLLARSSQPEVVLPGDPNRFDYGDDAIANRDRQWRAALAAAGVTCKEAR